MFDKILVVCIGNICRSPVAEGFLKQRLPESKHIRSAGISAMVGKPADPSSIELAKEKDVDISSHIAEQLNSKAIEWADLILVMEQEQLEHISNLAPHARGKIMLLGKWLGDKEIPDPYRRSKEAFVHCVDLIEESVLKWVEYLK